MNTNFHFDGHGLNDSNGTRILTFAKKPASDGGGYIMDRESMEWIAAYIVQACNSHYDLVEALRRLLRATESDYEQCPQMSVKTAFETNSQAIQQARAALKKAGGNNES